MQGEALEYNSTKGGDGKKFELGLWDLNVGS